MRNEAEDKAFKEGYVVCMKYHNIPEEPKTDFEKPKYFTGTFLEALDKGPTKNNKTLILLKFSVDGGHRTFLAFEPLKKTEFACKDLVPQTAYTIGYFAKPYFNEHIGKEAVRQHAFGVYKPK